MLFLPKKKTFFLILSGDRCGSTWLEMMLGELNDVAADYELQYIDKAPTPAHAAIKHPSFQFKKLLAGISSTKKILGSKLVLPAEHNFQEGGAPLLAKILPKSTKLIFISRNYFHSFLSLWRGAHHLRNNGYQKKNLQVDSWLLETWAETKLKQAGKFHIDEDYLRDNLEGRYKNERALLSSKKIFQKNLCVNYDVISDNFYKISRFIGSKDSAENIKYISNNPPTKKIHPVRYQDLIENFNRLQKLADFYEEKRKKLTLLSHDTKY